MVVMTATDISSWRFSCAFSSPVHPAGSAPPSFPSSSARAIRSSDSPARTSSAAALAAAGAEVHARLTRRPRRVALRGRTVRRRHPPRVQARHRLLGRLRQRRRAPTVAPSRAFGEALAGIRPSVRHRVRERWASHWDGSRPRRTGATSIPNAVRRARSAARPMRHSSLSLASRGVRVKRAAPPADRSRRGRQRLRRHAGRHRPRQGRVGVRRRRRQPLARRAPQRRGAPLPPRTRGRARRLGRCTRWPTRAFRSATSPKSIGRHLDIPVSQHRAGGRVRALRLAWQAFSPSTAPASSAITQRLLGWRPTGPGLIEDLDKGHYFDGANA